MNVSVTAMNVKGIIVRTSIRAVLEVVVRANLDNVGEEVAAREDEVLDNDVERVVGVLDARDRDVSDLNERISY